MDSGGSKDPPSGDQSQKKMSISLAASSMISASDIITPEAYQANLARIQEVKEMVRRLEFNNEAAHKNFVVEQLERRAKEGREAEDMLVRLRNQPELPETVQYSNNGPGDRSEVILPTTASVVEVPEPVSPSYSSPAPTVTSHSLQNSQQSRSAPVMYQWGFPIQIQPYNPDVLRYYTPPQYSMAQHPQATEVGQMGRYTTQNVPPESRVHNPPTYQTGFQQLQTQQPLHSWSSHPHQATALSGATTGPGHYISPTGQIRAGPVHGDLSAGSSNSTHRETGFRTESTTFRPPVTTHNQLRNLPSHTSTSQGHVPLQAAPAVPVQTPPGSHPPIQSHPTSVQPQPRLVSTAASKPVVIELQPPHDPSQRPRQPQQYSQQPSLMSQRFPQPPLQPKQHVQQSEARLPSQRPLQLPQTHLQSPPQPVDRASSTNVSQSRSQPTQPPQPIVAQEQVRQRVEHPRANQATFNKLFHNAVQRGTLHLKAFWLQAKASGVRANNSRAPQSGG